MQLKYVVLIMFFIRLLAPLASASSMPPIEEYEEHDVSGFTVLVSPKVKSKPELYKEVLKQVSIDLKAIVLKVPAESIDYLRDTRIWFEDGMPVAGLNFLFFNDSKRYTKEHGLVPESYAGVISGNSREYIAMSKSQPWQLLHELSHAFHRFDLKHSYMPIRRAYDNAREKQIYSRARDKRMPISAYQMKNQKEYFSELTVAYLARHRKFPHNRVELADVDPVGYCAVVKAWGLLGRQLPEPPLLCH